MYQCNMLIFVVYQILVASGVDLEVDSEIDGSAVFLPPGGVVVARLINPDAKKGLF